MRIRLASISIALGALLLSATAQAQDFGFGSKGQVVLDSTGSSLAAVAGVENPVLTPFISFATTSKQLETREDANSREEITQRSTIFLINPGIDVFVIDHLSIGGEVLIGKTSASDKTVTLDKRTGIETTRTDEAPSPTAFGIAPRIGYHIPIGRHFSFWPRGGFGFLRSGYSRPAPPAGTIDVSESWFVLFADAFFNWHPSQSFFIGIGPGLSTTVSHSRSSGNVSVSQPSIFSFRFLSFNIGGVID